MSSNFPQIGDIKTQKDVTALFVGGVDTTHYSFNLLATINKNIIETLVKNFAHLF